ncbi:MAG: nuclear transport factor 2 family protein [Candidatus Sulfotelmatobacter sp.]
MFSCGDKHMPARPGAILCGSSHTPHLMKRSILALVVVFILFFTTVHAQDSPTAEQIPIQRCGGLPVITTHINRANMSFLLDTASTTTLNLKSFSSGRSKRIPVTTWTGTTTADGRQISLPELTVGNHPFRDLMLPAVDLSAIEQACGRRIDGILGFDLLDKMDMTINLKRQVASVDMSPAEIQAEFAEMQEAMHLCNDAFHLGKVDVLKNCLDPAIVLYVPTGEFRGRKEVMDYLEQRYLRFAPNLRFAMTLRDMQSFGDVLWYSYDYTIDSTNEHSIGHGTAMCHRTGGHWRILNMHNSLLQPEAHPSP